MGDEITPSPEMRMKGGKVEGAGRFLLCFAMLDDRALPDDQFGNRIGELRRVNGARVRLHHCQPALLFRDDQVSRMRRNACFLASGNEKQMNRLFQRDVPGNINQGSVLEESRVQCRESIVLRLAQSSKLPLD